VSGIQHGVTESTFSRVDARTWFVQSHQETVSRGTASSGPAVAAVAPRRARAEIPAAQRREIAKAAVIKLLYSPHRIACNRDEAAVHAQRAADACRAHVKMCYEAHQLPYTVDLYRIQAYHAGQALPFTIYNFDPVRCDYYVGIICQVWEKVTRYYIVTADDGDIAGAGEDGVLHRVDFFEDFCFGVLYIMSKGHHVGSLILLERDDFLLANLPIGKHLPKFEIGRSRKRRGEKIVIETYRNALHLDAPLADLLVMPPPPQEDRGTREAGNGPMLFKPTSRRQ